MHTLTHTHARTYAHTRTRRHTHTDTHTHMRTPTQTQTQATTMTGTRATPALSGLSATDAPCASKTSKCVRCWASTHTHAHAYHTLTRTPHTYPPTFSFLTDCKADANNDNDGNESDTSSLGPERDRCAVCLEDIKVRTCLDKCFHEFCYTCILQWSEVSRSCPLCKTSYESLI